jgi:hypothetical protein
VEGKRETRKGIVRLLLKRDQELAETEQLINNLTQTASNLDFLLEVKDKNIKDLKECRLLGCYAVWLL